MPRPPQRRDVRFELVVGLIAFVVWQSHSSAPVYPLAAVLYALTGRSADDLDRIRRALTSAPPARRTAVKKQGGAS